MLEYFSLEKKMFNYCLQTFDHVFWACCMKLNLQARELAAFHLVNANDFCLTHACAYLYLYFSNNTLVRHR